MKLIVGLGNPGKEYVNTRHNAGFHAIDEVAKCLNVEIKEKQHRALIAKTTFLNEKVILCKPQTYMNLSGESIRLILDFYKIAISDVLIIYDDISLDLGMLRIRQKGSAGGHNGIKSIIAHLKTNEFARIKIGVGENSKTQDLKNYVLSKFSKSENEILSKVYSDTFEIVKLFFTDLNKAMNIYNTKKASLHE